MGHFERLSNIRRHCAELEVTAFCSCSLHQAHHRSQSTAVDKLHLLELQNDVAVLDEGVSNVRVQSKDFFPADDSSLALNDQDVANRAAVQMQLHHILLKLTVVTDHRSVFGLRRCSLRTEFGRIVLSGSVTCSGTECIDHHEGQTPEKYTQVITDREEPIFKSSMDQSSCEHTCQRKHS